MIFSMKRMTAILVKDFKDLSKNMYVLITILMPIGFAAIYGNADGLGIDMHYFIINLAFTCVAAFTQSAVIAEEKEKNTLRGLMLSPATTADILGGKSLLTFLTTVFTVVICMFLTGYEPANPLIVGIALLLSTLFYIAIGTLLGLLTKSVMEASVAILPVMFLFSFGGFLMPLAERYPVLKVMEYLPSVQLEQLAFAVDAGAGFGDIWQQIAVIAAWVVVGLVLTIVVYKKRRMDD